MNMEQLVEWELAEETEVLGGHLRGVQFVHHNSHMIWLGNELGTQRREEDL
jgi:hypothetical protein